MSKNRNRAKLNKAEDSREYNMIMKNQDLYCYICVRRVGHYNASCAPGAFSNRGWIFRMNRTWKHTRETQWKE